MKQQLASAASLTWSLNSIANGAGRQATKVDNTTNLYLDALFQATFKTALGSLATTPVVSVYLYGSEDGTTWADGITGSDAAWTAPATVNGILICQLPIVTAATATPTDLKSLALMYGGSLPPFWTVAMTNATGLALDGTAAGSASYRGLTTQ